MNILAFELARFYAELRPYDFYREIFGDGELDEAGAYTSGKYNAIAVEITDQKRLMQNGKEKIIVHRYTVTDDMDVVDQLTYSDHFCIMAPISYAGKSRMSKNARVMYALCVELDNLVTRGSEQLGLENLMHRYSEQAHYIPRPTYIVASGSGLHLYYKFEQPLVLFPNVVQSLVRYKEELTRMIWTKSVTVTHTEETIQQESIFQAFRMPGTKTKAGDRAVAFRTGEPVSVEYMNSFLNPNLKGARNIECAYKTDLPLAKAKELYPDWYEKVIVNKDHSRKKWAVSRRVYDWWLREIKLGAVDGHRYNCLKMLAIYAIKCGIYDEKKNPNPVTQEEFESDAWGLFEDFKARGKRADNPFRESDVTCAIQVYEDADMITYPRNSVAHKSGIRIVPQVRRREKGRQLKQAVHLARARAVQEIDYPDGSWREGNGRPRGSGTAHETVQRWRCKNPEGTKYRCVKETGLSKPTVYKWWGVPLPPAIDPFDDANVLRLDRESHATWGEFQKKTGND